MGSLNGELNPRNEIGLKLALHFLETSKLFQATSIGWAMFQYATYKHWSDLVELVLDYLSGFPEYLEKVNTTKMLFRIAKMVLTLVMKLISFTLTFVKPFLLNSSLAFQCNEIN